MLQKCRKISMLSAALLISKLVTQMSVTNIIFRVATLANFGFRTSYFWFLVVCVNEFVDVVEYNFQIIGDDTLDGPTSKELSSMIG